MADLGELLKSNDGTFPYKPGRFRVTTDMKRQFERDGYIIVRYKSMLTIQGITNVLALLLRMIM